ncbi:DUF4880 domain-containing protein [Gluconacetobacter azotocaptans]|uniref:DUF4880 domain-containing protein n=2 Tax=Gluconacetobacter azotocaptans TaxID=142834 RepID=A0A7W4JV15_9PROT|nr:DUF4880 domain-containing protein [Gluconacetobacter azotocaptans]GBQ29702.1 anti-FecI sigma factor FecR [Gluconacetobacter azotocaptans DSM 13594]
MKRRNTDPSGGTIAPDNPDDIAFGWVARLDRGALPAQAQAALDAWLASDTRHRGAFVRAQAIWLSLDRARALHAPAPPAVTPGAPQSQGRRHVMRFAAAAACAALVVPGRSQGHEHVWRTTVGASAPVPLPGGRLILDRDTLLMGYVQQGRPVETRLLCGRVRGDWTAGRSNAPVMKAGQTLIFPAAASFVVQQSARATEILVLAGAVRADAGSQEWSLGTGQWMRAGDGMPPRVGTLSADEMYRRTAWSRDTLELRTETLAEAAAILNLYNQRRIVVHGAALSAQRLVGVFRLSDPSAFARAVCSILGAEHVESPDKIDIF